MFQVDVGDCGNGWGVFKKGAVTFIGFCHDKVSFTVQGIGAEAFQESAHDHGGVKARMVENLSYHGGLWMFSPWAPDTAMEYLMRISSASISALGIIGMP